MKFLLSIIILLIPVAGFAQPLWMVRNGEVEIDQILLGEVLSKRSESFSLPVNGRDYAIAVELVSAPNLGVTSLRGGVEGQAETFFLLCQTAAGATVAFFQLGDGAAYRLGHTSGRLDLREVDYKTLGPCAGALTPEDVSRGRQVDRGPSRAVADDGSRHDILVAYTPAAETFMGGWDFIRAEAQLAVDAANLAYDNSNITSQLRLVHIMDTDYDEDTAWSYTDHVEYLWYPNDGYMDDVLSTREIVGADFVSVLIDGRDSLGNVPTCGAAPTMGPGMDNADFEDYALSIVSVQCATVQWSLAHEVGHNRGCAHNREDSGNDGAYTFSFGHRFWGADNAGYGTVMSYDNDAGEYTRIPYFSNPDVDYEQVPTGVAPGLAGEAHNALTHENTAAVCAAFRGERTFVQFGWEFFSNGLVLFPYPTIGDAIADSREGGIIAIKNDNPGFIGILVDQRTYVHSGEGNTVLGGQ